ncbi:MAG: hypothetical protein JXR95_02610 [Deltaproteobacteria bacterium]|nr:hypothetical protein [Deltaproteobacteria bacterium]
MKTVFSTFFVIPIFLISGCKNSSSGKSSVSDKGTEKVNLTSGKKSPDSGKTVKKIHRDLKTMKLPDSTISFVRSELIKKHGTHETVRITKSVEQTASLWNIVTDGDEKVFKKFCMENFTPEGKKLDSLFTRLEKNFETIWGHNERVKLDLSFPVHVNTGKLLKIDKIFAAYNGSAHFLQDMFENKVAFITILNFPFYTLDEKNTLGEKWNRKKWAHVRMGDVFTSRVPQEIRKNIEKEMTIADDYISGYNIYMGMVVDTSKKSLFPKDMKLISHWNLRDELKTSYGDKKNGFAKQQTILKIMKHIINQTIPKAVINNGKVVWNPVTNKVFQDGKEISSPREPDTRYEYLLRIFNAVKKEDRWAPRFPTYI